MIAAVRSDPALAVVSVIAVVVIVLATRHGRTWWHRHTGDHHPARTGRLVMAGAALLGLGALTVGMSLGGEPASSPSAGDVDRDGREAPGGLVFGGPVPGVPDAGPVTDSAGS